MRHHPDARTTLDIDTLAVRIVARRAALHLEQVEVAERANRSRAYISRLEGALVPNPKLFDLAAIAAALEMTLSELVAPESTLVETRYSHEWAEIQQQTEHLPPELREQVLRGFKESLALLNAASELARRN